MSSQTLEVAVIQVGGMTAPELIVLPERVTTPYFCTRDDPGRAAWAIPIPGPFSALFAALATQLGCTIAFGTYEQAEDGTGYHSLVVVDRHDHVCEWDTPVGGTVPAYRKLSIPACTFRDVEIDEKFHLAAGESTATVDVSVTRLGSVVCYDRSVSEYWAAARGLGARVMLAIVSSLGSREELFLAELQTRAIESQMWIVAASRGGEETVNGFTASYFGRSCVISPTGEIIAEAVVADRTAFPSQRDRRSDMFNLVSNINSGARQPHPIAVRSEPAPSAP